MSKKNCRSCLYYNWYYEWCDQCECEVDSGYLCSAWELREKNDEICGDDVLCGGRGSPSNEGGKN